MYGYDSVASVVILRSAHVAMRERQTGLGTRFGDTIQAILKNGVDAAETGGIQAQGSVTRGLQSGVAVCFAHAQYAKAGAIALLRMTARVQHDLHRGMRLHTNARRPI